MRLGVLLAVAGLDGSQEPAAPTVPLETVEWSVAMAGRFRQLQNPIVRAYALGRLAGSVCPHDRPAGSLMLRQAFADMNEIPRLAFRESRSVLPVSGFTRLRQALTRSAGTCDPAIANAAKTARSRVEAALLGLRDETRFVQAMAGFAESRLK